MTKSDVQTSLRLPEELRDRLAAASAAEGRGIGEEIRRRLEASFGSAPASEDTKTGNLLRVIARAAAILDEHWSAWHADAGAFAVFHAAIEDVLMRQQPDNSGAVPKTDRGASLFHGDPERAGGVLAFTAEMAENLI
jgi:phytoene/squalene synthetase